MSSVRHITLPEGFRAGGVACGIKPSGKRDLAIVAGEADLSAAIVTTRNQIVGAPIQWCRGVLPRGAGKVRGIVINAGCSNVCTGKAGYRDTEEMARRTGERLGCEAEKVLVASTGVIGVRLPMGKVRKGIDEATKHLSRMRDSEALQAIMTTDLREKSAVVQLTLQDKPVTVAGMVKGSGMIAPSMATMIGVLTTDAAVAPGTLGKILRRVCAASFNAITVDSDTSTSDIVALLASGASGVKIKPDSPAAREFTAAVEEICRELARAVVADGEGATRVVDIEVRGARSDREAEMAAKSVANSPLVKTAIHGADPNWGRIAAALGKSSARIEADKLSIDIAGVRVFINGRGRPFDEKAVSQKLAQPEVVIRCDLGLGNGRYTALTCDLSREYIAINADYTT
jgi:glutamate N-acetyltransferase/amino-acid N-acetyltransferase